MNTAVYIIGLVVVLCCILFSIDDLIWDFACLFRKKGETPEDMLEIRRLDDMPPKLLAVMVPAWHEESVLEPVVDNMIASIQYPRSMYHIFLGVYPNDDATVNVAEKLQAKYENVHMVVNRRPGPTCKADNVNSIIRFIRDFEASHDWRFASVTVHDAEDVVHPYELKVTNYLIETYDALQFPVFPLLRMPSVKNFFSGMTSGTYADEFAENHFRTMRMRDCMSALVPSAGTGFAISHRILDAFVDTPLFPEDSLMDDYKLSLTFAKMGYTVHYVLEKVMRVTDRRETRWDYIATRSLFPATLKAAVRQKTRWIYGITMQSAKLSDIFVPSRLTFAGRYTLYRDRKSKFTNLVTLPTYLVILYAAASLFVSLPVVYPIYSISWWLCVALAVMLILRQTFRAVAIRFMYGFKSVAFACLLPPLIPIRFVWGDMINTAATMGAWQQLLFGFGKRNRDNNIAWNKTHHEFIDKNILYRYQRKLGDVLLEKQVLSPYALQQLLAVAKNNEKKLGEILLEREEVTEEQLSSALASVNHKVYASSLAPYDGELLKYFNIDRLWDAYLCPVLRLSDRIVYAVTVFTPQKFLNELLAGGGEVIYTTKLEIVLFLSRVDPQSADPAYSEVFASLRDGRITWEQAVIALNCWKYSRETLRDLGLAQHRNTLSENPQKDIIQIAELNRKDRGA